METNSVKQMVAFAYNVLLFFILGIEMANARKRSIGEFWGGKNKDLCWRDLEGKYRFNVEKGGSDYKLCSLDVCPKDEIGKFAHVNCQICCNALYNTAQFNVTESIEKEPPITTIALYITSTLSVLLLISTLVLLVVILYKKRPKKPQQESQVRDQENIDGVCITPMFSQYTKNLTGKETTSEDEHHLLCSDNNGVVHQDTENNAPVNNDSRIDIEEVPINCSMASSVSNPDENFDTIESAASAPLNMDYVMPCHEQTK